VTTARASHLLYTQGRRSGVVTAGASHLMARGRRSGAAMAGAFHLMARGRRSGAARGRSKPPVAISSLLFYELQMLLANHGRSRRRTSA
jgi:hypothetical protein